MTLTKSIFILLFCCLLFLPVGICSANSYLVTEDEFNSLNQIFEQLEQNNNQLSTELTASKKDLQTALTELKELKTQLAMLQKESQLAKSELETANNLLAQDAKLLKGLKREQNSLKWQRNIASLVAVYFAAKGG